MPRNRRFHWILPATKGAALHWMPPAKAALPPLETTAKGTLSPLDSPANRVLSPLLDDPEPKEFAIPLESQMRFEMSTHKEKNDLWALISKRKPQNVIR